LWHEVYTAKRYLVGTRRPLTKGPVNQEGTRSGGKEGAWKEPLRDRKRGDHVAVITFKGKESPFWGRKGRHWGSSRGICRRLPIRKDLDREYYAKAARKRKVRGELDAEGGVFVPEKKKGPKVAVPAETKTARKIARKQRSARAEELLWSKSKGGEGNQRLLRKRICSCS